MASTKDSPDVPVKYESLYDHDQPPLFPPELPVSPSTPGTLKRQRSDEDMGDAGLKRLRVDSDPLPMNNDDLAALLAHATAETSQQLRLIDNLTQAPVQQLQQPAPLVPAPATPLFQQPYNDPRNKPSEDDQHPDDEYGSGFVNDPRLFSRILSLPILDGLATQILAALAQGPWFETISMVTEPESELGQTFATLKSLFDQTKKLYSQDASFLSASELNFVEPEHRAIIRTANLVTWAASVFGGQDVGFYELNDNFIETFTPDGQAPEKDPGQLFLDLKTQMYLSSILDEEQNRSKEEIIEGLFPNGLDLTLMDRHPGTPLSQIELGIVEASKRRREHLSNEPHDTESIQKLSDEYGWEAFLQNLTAHLNQAYKPLLAPFIERYHLTVPASSALAANRTAIQKQNANSNHQQNENPLNSIEVAFDLEAELNRVIQSTVQDIKSDGQDHPQQNGRSQQQDHKHQPQGPSGSHQTQYSEVNLPHPSQRAPTQVLYEQARQAAVAKANPGTSRRPGLPSQRRPWSSDEENALMAGLDQVKGPHWSQILALYGANGQVSDILKDRNQVQLKDKARNLKLFFLKSSIDVPYYLQCVTGELKTRAPSQAARKEAEERTRNASEGAQAHFNGIMALAGGIRDHSQEPSEALVVSSPGAESKSSDDEQEESHATEAERAHTLSTSPPMNDEQHLRQLLVQTNSGDNGVQTTSYMSMAT